MSGKIPLDIDSLKWEANSGLIIWDDLLKAFDILIGISLVLLFSRPLISSDIS